MRVSTLYPQQLQQGATLFVALGRAATVLLEAAAVRTLGTATPARSPCIPQGPCIATLSLPPVRPPTEDAVVPFPLNQQCNATLHSCPNALLLTAPNVPPTERSQAWSDAVLTRLQPSRVHVVCTVEAHEYVGDADPTSTALAFVLANRAATLPEGVPTMPQDLLLQGAAAALLLQCQVWSRALLPCSIHCVGQFQGTPCTCVAGVQASQVPDPALLHQLAVVSDGVAGSVPLVPSVQKAAGRLEDVFRSSASASLYA